MIYADFNYYQLEYHGIAITDPDVYERQAIRAAAELDYYTFGRAAHNADHAAVKMASCAIAEQLCIVENASASAYTDAAEVQSESVGSYSRTYRSGVDRVESARLEIRGIIERYLAHTGLMYRGVNGCTCHIM